MDLTVLTPSLAGLIGVLVGAGISSWTQRSTHKDRLAADRELAERKITADIALAERKLNADIALAEKKLSLDRAFAGWTRKTEFAEQVLADFYEAQRIIGEARSPGTARDEGVTRQKWDDETEEETRTLNAYFVAAERLNSKQEFFAQLHARRYRFLAYFGRDAAKPYDDLHKIYAEILVAVRMLIVTHRQRDMGFTPQTIPQLKTTIGWGLPENDPIPARLDRIVEAIEKTCQPVIQELAG
jgi:hypothetical protein